MGPFFWWHLQSFLASGLYYKGQRRLGTRGEKENVLTVPGGTGSIFWRPAAFIQRSSDIKTSSMVCHVVYR